MRKRAGILALAGAALAAGWLWLSWLQTPSDAPDALPGAEGVGTASPVVDAPAPVQATPLGSRGSPQPPPVAADRTEALAEKMPQGLRGLCLDERGLPVEGAHVYLVDSAGNDPLALPFARQNRLPASPLATAKTAADGVFLVGLPRVQDRTYELYLLAEGCATSRIGGLHLLAGQWHDLGAITLVPGAMLRGRVTVRGLATPVPQAIVTVDAFTAFEDVALRSLPDGRRGLVAAVNAAGRYELQNVPTRSVVRVAAIAPGFARSVASDVRLSPDQPVELDFELAPGLALTGSVTDPDGMPVADARVEAWPAKRSEPALVALADADGRFTVHGLSEGPHRVRVAARGYHTLERPDVTAGSSDLQFTLDTRGRVRVRVTTPAGNVVRSYQLAVRRWFPDRAQVAFVADVPEQRVRLDGLTDTVEVTGLPSGTFVCQATTDDYAPSLSAPFEIGDETTAASAIAEVVLSRGSALHGFVLDEAGAPLAGATVATQPAGASPDSPLWKLVSGAVPDRVTPRTHTTAADGAFALRNLAPGDYQLAIAHPDACATIVPLQPLDGTSELTLPAIRLPRGALVTGRVTHEGRIPGPVKVVLTAAGMQRNGQGLRLETISDTEGRFRMPRRIPPGEYDLRAAIIGTAEPESQISRQILQLQRTLTTVVVAPGQHLVERDIDIPRAN
jgi:protocatechuate 3,4-dioxygenase beta subunit